MYYVPMVLFTMTTDRHLSHMNKMGPTGNWMLQNVGKQIKINETELLYWLKDCFLIFFFCFLFVRDGKKKDMPNKTNSTWKYSHSSLFAKLSSNKPTISPVSTTQIFLAKCFPCLFFFFCLYLSNFLKLIIFFSPLECAIFLRYLHLTLSMFSAMGS